MKNLLIGLIATVTFGFVGNAQYDVKKWSVILAKDQNFISLIQNIAKIPNPTKIEEFQSIISKNNYDDNDLMNLAIAFGFKDIEQARQFDSVNAPLQIGLVKKYSLNDLKFDELEDLVNAAIILLPPYQNVTNGNCEDRRSNCRLGANAIYVLEYSGCVAAGIGLGGVTFWCGGCVGAAIGSICVAASVAHLVSNIQECNFNYEDCRG